MSYDEFVISVTAFFEAFVSAMDKQVEDAVMKDWERISLDKQQLVKENAERKSGFLQDITFLKDTPVSTDWNKVMALYLKMEAEINSVV